MNSLSKGNRLVNSWTEWGPLEEVVIGHSNDICFEPQEPGFKIEFGDAFLRDKLVWCEGRWPKKYVEAANRELDYLCEVLESEGVKVRRPDNIKNYISSQVPDGKSCWRSYTQYGALFPRDIMTTIGNNILEAPTSRRGRYFEYLAYRNITRDLWRRDPNCCWKACPKPSMSDSMYWEDFWNLTETEHLAAEGDNVNRIKLMYNLILPLFLRDLQVLFEGRGACI
jgi:amidinotransferase